MFLSRKFCLAGQAQLTQHYIAVDSFRLEGKLLAELWIRGSVLQLVGRPPLVCSPHYHLPPSLSLVTRHRRLASLSSSLCSIHHCNENCLARFPPFGFLSSTMFFFLLSNGCNFQCSEVQYFSQNLLK